MPPVIDIQGRKFGRLLVLTRQGSPKHGAVTWLCRCDCGTEKVIIGQLLREGLTRSCGCYAQEHSVVRATGSRNLNWKGGRKKWGHGYVACLSHGHPNADWAGYVAEHRLVMEKELGRPLHRDEHVHHKNGIKTDNRPENLELWSTRHPSGQRVEDLVAWAKEILNLYG